MKKRHTTHVSTHRKREDLFRAKAVIQAYTTANNYAKIRPEYASPAKSSSSNSSAFIRRSISLNKPDGKIAANRILMGCTYFGAGFRGTARVSPSPYSGSRLAAAMRRTAVYWSSVQQAARALRRNCLDYPGHGAVSAVSARSQCSDYSSNSKEMHLPAISEKRKRPQETRSQLKGAEPTKDQIRAFNWEGIHFEITPRREGSSCDSMRPGYQDDMNLMHYNFNCSTNRVGSDSAEPETKEENGHDSSRTTASNIENGSTTIRRRKFSNGSPLSRRTGEKTKNTNARDRGGKLSHNSPRDVAIASSRPLLNNGARKRPDQRKRSPIVSSANTTSKSRRQKCCCSVSKTEKHGCTAAATPGD